MSGFTHTYLRLSISHIIGRRGSVRSAPVRLYVGPSLVACLT